MSGRLKKFLNLDAEDRGRFVGLWLRLLVMWFELRLSRRYRRELTDTAQSSPAPGTSWDRRSVENILRLLNMAARNHLLPMTCLVTALTGCRYLRARGVPAAVRVGVNRDQGEFNAHAWIELHGEAIGDSGESVRRFAVLGRAAG